MAVRGADRQLMAELHRPILDAVRSGDAARAEAAIRQHFETARRSLADRWVERPAPVPVGATAGSTERTR
jgi:DNA-binding GntR family transcriptional regulator